MRVKQISSMLEKFLMGIGATSGKKAVILALGSLMRVVK